MDFPILISKHLRTLGRNATMMDIFLADLRAPWAYLINANPELRQNPLFIILNCWCAY